MADWRKQLTGMLGTFASTTPFLGTLATISDPFSMDGARAVGGGVVAPAAEAVADAATLPGDAYQGRVEGPEMVDRATNLAMTLPLASLPLSAALGPTGSSLGMFVGPASKTFDRAAVDRAVNLKSRGATPTDVWQETGTFRDPFTGHWKQEIDDSKAFATPYIDSQFYKNQTRGKWLKHPKLWKAYPRLRGDKMVRIADDARAGNAAFDPVTRTTDLYVPETPGIQYDPKGGMLHEAQHAIQGIEDWPGGANTRTTLDLLTNTIKQYRERDVLPQGMTFERLHGLQQEAKQALDHQPLRQGEMFSPQELNDQMWVAKSRDGRTFDRPFNTLEEAQRVLGDGWKFEPVRINDTPWPELQSNLDMANLRRDLYRRERGEVEARNVTNRQSMTPEQRREMPPWTTEDVPLDRQWTPFRHRSLWSFSEKTPEPMSLWPGTREIDMYGRRYRVRPFEGFEGKQNYMVDVEVNKKGGGKTWRTLNGLNNANRNSESQRVVKKFLEGGDKSSNYITGPAPDNFTGVRQTTLGMDGNTYYLAYRDGEMLRANSGTGRHFKTPEAAQRAIEGKNK